MSKISKFIAITATAAFALSACSSDSDTSESTTTIDTTASGDLVELKVGASPVPHADILQFVADNLAEEAGLKLDIVEYTDYVQPNVALDAGELDANYFQHLPYLNEEIATKGYSFEHGEGIHIEPIGLYSDAYTSIDEIPDGGTVVVTNDPSNQARALKLLESAGLLALADVEAPTLYDIAENPKNLDIKEAEAAAIPVQLPDVDAAVINGNYALEAGLVPSKDALQLESGEDNPYGNVLAWNTDGEKLDAVKKLDELLHSPEVAQFITEKYPNGEVTPAFTN